MEREKNYYTKAGAGIGLVLGLAGMVDSHASGISELDISLTGEILLHTGVTIFYTTIGGLIGRLIGSAYDPIEDEITQRNCYRK